MGNNDLIPSREEYLGIISVGFYGFKIQPREEDNQKVINMKRS